MVACHHELPFRLGSSSLDVSILPGLVRMTTILFKLDCIHDLELVNNPDYRLH